VGGSLWGVAGGTRKLVDLIDEHRTAFDYDWRTRFHLGVDDIPATVGWDEAWRLFTVLALDPSSQIAAALAGWQQPVSREDLTIRDLFDLQHKAQSSRRPKPYPRPWDKVERRKFGGPGVSISEFEAAKRRLRQDPDEEATDG
jgi:hypothetical protein